MKPRHIPLQCLQVLDGMVLGASEEIWGGQFSRSRSCRYPYDLFPMAILAPKNETQLYI
jgi:hypothetical protein